MNDLLVGNMVSLLVFGLLYFTSLFTPKLSRKDLIFGVFIPIDRTTDSTIIEASKKYTKDLTIITLLTVVIFLLLFNTIFKHPIFMVLMIFIMISEHFLVFLRARNKVKIYKSENNLVGNKKQVVYVNTTMSKKLRKNAVLSSYWFLIPLFISLAGLVLPLMKYDQLPNKIPTHFNLQGIADNFAEKSVGSVIANSGMTIVLVIILALSNLSIAYSKNKIDASSPHSSAKRLYKFKKINSIMVYILAIVLSTLITFFNLNALNIISVNIKDFSPLFITIFVLIIFAPLIILFKTGQGGSNLKDSSNEEIDNTVTNVDDDDLWKLGSIYYNPNDPSLFVEKRFGVGWTLNYGNKMSIIITVLFIIFILSTILMAIIFS
ncbi:MAG: DUF1648 domain-containing protein [Clostridiaceae bacterium]